MFGNKSKLNPSATDTLIGEGSIFEGNITSQASLRIEGKLIGDIECVGDVTVGERGTARSTVTARNVTVAGEVHGDITVTALLTVTSTGKLYGNVNCQSLVIAEGALFHGHSRMSATSESPSAAASNRQHKNTAVEQ